MEFHEFLERLKTKKNCATSKQLFFELGGEKKLGIKERRWLQISNGSYPPPMHLLASLFSQIDPEDKKDFIASFFQSALDEGSGRKQLIDYIQQEIRPPRPKAEVSPYDRPFQYYSDDQLELLADNTRAFRLYKRVLLLDDAPLKLADLKRDAAAVKQLVDMELLEVTKTGVLQTVKKRYRLPRFETHGARSVALSNKYIARHFDNYVSWEGNPSQTIEFSSLTVAPDRAEAILKEATEFRHWIHSQACEEARPDQVPMVGVIFIKQLKRNEL